MSLNDRQFKLLVEKKYLIEKMFINIINQANEISNNNANSLEVHQAEAKVLFNSVDEIDCALKTFPESLSDDAVAIVNSIHMMLNQIREINNINIIKIKKDMEEIKKALSLIQKSRKTLNEKSGYHKLIIKSCGSVIDGQI